MIVSFEEKRVRARTGGRIGIRSKYSAPAGKCKPYLRFLRKKTESAEKKPPED
jgi:hypothetical protein